MFKTHNYNVLDEFSMDDIADKAGEYAGKVGKFAKKAVKPVTDKARDVDWKKAGQHVASTAKKAASPDKNAGLKKMGKFAGAAGAGALGASALMKRRKKNKKK